MTNQTTTPALKHSELDYGVNSRIACSGRQAGEHAVQFGDHQPRWLTRRMTRTPRSADHNPGFYKYFIVLTLGKAHPQRPDSVRMFNRVNRLGTCSDMHSYPEIDNHPRQQCAN
ncbi:hypothetical protein [Mycobacterium lepromatosis]|uniref:hypothetical protein n=1 Tax=Mycobacterium lepromatosis TaxID=480418 RepID=UPI001F1B5D45|nr:hypothetical protein [Mycobacterium lepromatosis]